METPNGNRPHVPEDGERTAASADTRPEQAGEEEIREEPAANTRSSMPRDPQ
ncbi:MAG: hypothetical protein AAGD86_07420 [Pseudomonadota bacterium]